MSIRTNEQLNDTLSEDLVWRKKELSTWRFVVENKDHAVDRQPTLLRGAIALLYAHWEGYVKSASRAYIDFVHHQRLKYEELAPNFIALGARSLMNQAVTSSKIGQHLAITEFFRNKMGDRCSLPYKVGLNTKSNLSSQVLKDIVTTLGLDYSFFETKEMLLDERLLKQRNTIAHGEYLLVDIDDYREMSDQVLSMLEVFRTEIDNAAALRTYLR
jgi:hypothetical protein